jgi:hypothetical protein
MSSDRDDTLELHKVAIAQYAALKSDIERRRRRCDDLHRLLEHLESQTARDEHMLAEMEAMLDLTPQMRIEQLDHRLRGKRLLEVAVELLTSHSGSGVPIHYRAWFTLVQDAGHQIGGKDPLGTFLAQVNRAPQVEPVGHRSGLYQIRAA